MYKLLQNRRRLPVSMFFVRADLDTRSWRDREKNVKTINLRKLCSRCHFPSVIKKKFQMPDFEFLKTAVIDYT